MNTEETTRLLARLEQSEDPWVERKQSYQEQDVRRTLVGFANSVGERQTAVMFIGADNAGKHKGVPDADEVQRKIGNIMERCYPRVAYKTCVLPIQVDGTALEVLAILVFYSKDRPHFAGLAYVRQGSETKEASPEIFKELVASQNDKARRILQFKDKKVWLRVVSKSGFWYEHEGIVEFCDAITFRFTRKDGPNSLWAFPVAEIEIHADSFRDLVITAKADCTEEEHIRTMVRLWSYTEPTRPPHDYRIRLDHPIAKQFLANPGLALPAVSALADGSTSTPFRMLLLYLRFALKKAQNSLSRVQKLKRLELNFHERMKGKNPFSNLDLSAAAVHSTVEIATSLEEAEEFLKFLSREHVGVAKVGYETLWNGLLWELKF